MQSNRLQLNTAKTEVLWCATSRRRYQRLQIGLRVGTDNVPSASSVRDLGIYVDSDVSMRTHVSKTVSSCYAVLRQLRSIRRSVLPAVLQSLDASLVLSRLNYGNATLYCLPGNQIDRLHSVMNAAARLVFSARKYEHVTPLLRDLHWLLVSDRIEFKLSMLVFRCLHGTAPAYLSDELHRVADSGTRRRLRSTSSPALVVPTTRRTTIGDRSCPVAGARVWNALPSFVTDSSTISTF